MRTDILILCMSSRLRTRKRGKTLFTYLFQRSVCCWVANRCQRSPYVTESSDLRFIVSVVLMCALCQGENCRVLEGSTPSCYDPSSPTTPQPGVDGNSASTFCTCNVPLHDLNDVGRNWCIYDQARRHRELAKPALTRVQRPTPARFCDLWPWPFDLKIIVFHDTPWNIVVSLVVTLAASVFWGHAEKQTGGSKRR